MSHLKWKLQALFRIRAKETAIRCRWRPLGLINEIVGFACPQI